MKNSKSLIVSLLGYIAPVFLYAMCILALNTFFDFNYMIYDYFEFIGIHVDSYYTKDLLSDFLFIAPGLVLILYNLKTNSDSHFFRLKLGTMRFIGKFFVLFTLPIICNAIYRPIVLLVYSITTEDDSIAYAISGLFTLTVMQAVFTLFHSRLLFYYLIKYTFFIEVFLRGYLFNRLHKEYSIVSSSIITGFVWFALYLAVILSYTNIELLNLICLLIYIQFSSIIFSFIYIWSNKSVLMCAMFHALCNCLYFREAAGFIHWSMVPAIPMPADFIRSGLDVISQKDFQYYYVEDICGALLFIAVICYYFKRQVRSVFTMLKHK